MVLAGVVWRASVEMQLQDIRNPDELRDYFFAWLHGLGIAGELEPQERAFLQKPFGRVDEKLVAQSAWRSEGLAVLAWALKRFALPAYDIAVFVPDPAQESVGFGNRDVARELLDTGALRPSSEIDRFASHMTMVSWRLRQFGMQPTPMDFVGYLRSFASFKESWLEDLRLVDGDLAIGAQSIDEAAPEDVQRCRSIAVERQIAVYWLQGDDTVYSKVDPATLLSVC
jgi:hypothetical protein